MNNRTELCPVCGMAVESSLHRLDYRKMTIPFCSQQCCEMFAENPSLYSRKQGSVRDEIIKQRRLLLAAPTDEETRRNIEATLQDMMGIREIRVDGNRLIVRYDLMQVTCARIAQALHHAGVQLAANTWRRVGRAWIDNLEQNELKNRADRNPACCNRSPPRG